MTQTAPLLGAVSFPKMIYDLISISISSDEAELLKMEAALD
jgi:hypothetical protein